MAERSAFPWDAALAFGLGVMRLAPRDFWAMTPRELAAAMRAHGAGELVPMTGNELGELMSAFPDG